MRWPLRMHGQLISCSMQSGARYVIIKKLHFVCSRLSEVAELSQRTRTIEQGQEHKRFRLIG